MSHTAVDDASQATLLTSSSSKNNIGYIVGPYKGTSKTAVVTINVPNGWDKLATFMTADRFSYGTLYQARKAADLSSGVLESFADAAKVENCTRQNDLIQQLMK